MGMTDEIFQAHNMGYTAGRLLLLNDLRIIRELVQGDDPDQALELLTGSYEGEDRDLLIKIFKLEDLWKEWQG